MFSRRISRPNSPDCPSTPIIPACPHTDNNRNDATIHVCNRPNVPISTRASQHISALLITPAAPPTRARKAFSTQTYCNIKNSQVPHSPYPVTYMAWNVRLLLLMTIHIIPPTLIELPHCVRHLHNPNSVKIN